MRDYAPAAVTFLLAGGLLLIGDSVVSASPLFALLLPALYIGGTVLWVRAAMRADPPSIVHLIAVWLPAAPLVLLAAWPVYAAIVDFDVVLMLTMIAVPIAAAFVAGCGLGAGAIVERRRKLRREAHLRTGAD